MNYIYIYYIIKDNGAEFPTEYKFNIFYYLYYYFFLYRGFIYNNNANSEPAADTEHAPNYTFLICRLRVWWAVFVVRGGERKGRAFVRLSTCHRLQQSIHHRLRGEMGKKECEYYRTEKNMIIVIIITTKKYLRLRVIIIYILLLLLILFLHYRRHKSPKRTNRVHRMEY